MSTTTLNGRIGLKTDSYENFSANNQVLLKGEVAASFVPDTNDGNPTVLIKMGDGVTSYNALPWLSALAADVFDWAKGSEKPTYDTSEITDATGRFGSPDWDAF